MSPGPPETGTPHTAGPASPWRVLRWAVLLIVLALVGWRARSLWIAGQASGAEVSIHFGWLGAAAAIYLAGWLPSVWFWRCLLRDAGHHVGWLTILRAYYCGHLGKYVPGKATVLVIRSALLRSANVPTGTAAWTATWESLLVMGTGGLLGLGLAPQLLASPAIRDLPGPLGLAARHPFLLAAAVVVAVLAGFPWLTRLVTKATRWMLGPTSGDVSVSTRQVLIAVTAQAVGWLGHGLSLWWTLKGIGATPLGDSTPGILAGLTAAVGLATALGFVAVFAPGGVGIREGLLIEALSFSGLPLQQAVVVSILLRGVWLVAEITAAAVLYYGHRPATLPVPLESDG